MKPIRIVLSPTRSRPLNIFLGLMVALVALLLLLALATYRASDPSLNTATGVVLTHGAQNWIGLCGAYLSDLLLQALGVSAFLLPLWLGGLAWAWMHSRPGGSAPLRWIGTLLALIFVPTLFGLVPWHWRWLGVMPVEGVVGRLMAGMLVGSMNVLGAWIVAGVMALVGFYFSSAVSFWALRENLEDRWLNLLNWRDRWRNWREERAEERELRAAMRVAEQTGRAPKIAPRPGRMSADDLDEAPERRGFFGALLGRRKRAEDNEFEDEIPAYQRARFTDDGGEIPLSASNRRASIWERGSEAVAAEEDVPETMDEEPHLGPVPVPRRVIPFASESVPEASVAEEALNEEEPLPVAPVPGFASEPGYTPDPRAEEAIAIHARIDVPQRPAAVAQQSVSGFKLPPSTLLYEGEGPQSMDEGELREDARVLMEKCAEFDVRGQVVQITPGPMVTTFEFKPEAGVKYSRVTGLAEDLCLAMRAESILIERIPGKSTVGIQVPNAERETIHLRSVIESEKFVKAKGRLVLAMGKDINGGIVTEDLAAMPHLLIAGSTGSGKSVAINAMITSLLFRMTPDQVRLILVDPKRVELSMYAGIPHLFTPIITDPKLAANALRNAVREMERRLKLLASHSVRNIEHYNKLFEGSMPLQFDDDAAEEGPLPFIVIIIDELADLMMLDRANVEESITRLAQMARAVGIHLILATQRPSVDVITGLIKANVPTRLSFRLASKVDSRTILDSNGAESLLGRGDMLFLPPGTSRQRRLHAPYVSEKETAAVVGFWKAQGEAEYIEGFLEAPKDEHGGDGTGAGDEDNDPLFDDAVRLVFEFGKASTSLLQRRLRVGYGRAAHLVDMMERDGLVGPADGSRPRELLKPPGWLHEVAADQR
jgi:S-DNA-T family DNA segregation ATPase FtsK/SpoIIIE